MMNTDKRNHMHTKHLSRPDSVTRWSCLLWTLPLLVLFLMSSPVFINQSNAQGARLQYSSYVTPFPERGTYRILVLGDSIGEGLSFGLSKAFKNDRSLQLINRARWGTGFSRRKHIGRTREFEPLLASIKPDIVLISVGAKDAVASILEGNKKHRFGTERWKQIYSERLDKILRRLKKQKTAVYWIGLPIMRDPVFNENMNTLNEMFREKAHLNNIKFIDTWNGFVDQYGNFSPYGPDLDGRVLRLRDKDGIRFTATGYRKLAHYVEREIRRDLIAARSERNVPLAGDASEQREINQKKSIGKLSKIPGANSGSNSDGGRKGALRTTSSAAAFGEVIASDRASGLTLLSSITRTNDPSLSGGRHTLPLTLRPYYRVLVKGETLASKPGRSDDFTQNKIN